MGRQMKLSKAAAVVVSPLSITHPSSFIRRAFETRSSPFTPVLSAVHLWSVHPECIWVFVPSVKGRMEDEGTFLLLATWPRCIKARNRSPMRRLLNISGAALASALCHWPLMLTCSFLPSLLSTPPLSFSPLHTFFIPQTHTCKCLPLPYKMDSIDTFSLASVTSL